MTKLQSQINNNWRLAGPGDLRVIPYVIASLLIFSGLALSVRMIVIDDFWPHTGDLGVYLNAGDAIAQGKSPYDIDFEHDLNGYAYPPLFAELIAALTFVLGDGKLWIIWSISSLGLLAGCIVLMLRAFGSKTDYRWVLLIVGVAMASRMVRGESYHGQINILLLLLLLLGLKALLSGRVFSASVAWAVMIVLKPFMGIIVIYQLRRQAWKCAILTAAIACVLFAASFLPVFPNVIQTFVGWIKTSHAHTSLPFIAKPGNQSFYGLFNRLFAESIFSEPWIDAPWLIGILMLPIIGAALIIFLRTVPSQPIVRPSSRPNDGLYALLEVGLVMALSLSCGPLLEGDYVFFMLPGLFATVMLACIQIKDYQRRILWLSAAAWFVGLAAVVPPITVKILEPYVWSLKLSGLTILGTARVCVSLFIAAMLYAAALRRDRSIANGAVPVANQNPEFSLETAPKIGA